MHYNDMPNGRIARRRNRDRYLVILYKVLPPLLILLTLVLTGVHWRGMTVCFQKQALTDCLWMLYLQFFQSGDPFERIIETFAFFFLFLAVEVQNNADIRLYPECLDPKESLFLTVITAIFDTALYGYTGAVLMALLIVFGTMIYAAVKRYILIPWRRRQALARLQRPWRNRV